MKKNNGLLIIILTVGVFGILNTEMGIIGILPQVAAKFDVSLPRAGILVAGFAAVVAISGPVLPPLFSGVNRKTVMVAALSVFVAGNAVSIFATDFNTLLISRLIPAFFHPVYVSMAFAVAADSADKALRAKAAAKIFIGVSGGFVLGVPVTNFIASEISFAAAMTFFAAVNISVLAATIIFMPSMPVGEKISYGSQLRVLKKPALWLSVIIVLLLNGGIFGFFSYMSDFLDVVSGFTPGFISTILFFYGVANIAGNLVAGRALAANAKSSVAALPFLLTAVYGVLFFAGGAKPTTLVMTIILGVFAGVAANVNQYLVTDAAPEAPLFANGLFLTSANLGVTAGASFCGAFIASSGTRYAALGAVAMLVLSAVFIFVRLYAGTRPEAGSSTSPEKGRMLTRAGTGSSGSASSPIRAA